MVNRERAQIEHARDVLERHSEHPRYVLRFCSDGKTTYTTNSPRRPDDLGVCERCCWVRQPCPEVLSLAKAWGVEP